MISSSFKSTSAISIAAALFLFSPLAVQAQDIFVDNAQSVTSNSTTDFLIRNGQIVAMSAELTAPDDVDVISDAWISPPLVAPISALGLVDISGERTTNDISADTEFASASLQAVDSYNPRAVHIGNSRRRGIVYAAVAPNPGEERIFGGVGLISDLGGGDDGVLEEAAFLHIALGQSGSGRAGGSRSAAIAQLRIALEDAERVSSPDFEGDVLGRRDARVLRQVVRGDMPLLISANRASDLLRIVDLKSDLDSLEIIIVGAQEAYLVADQLANAGIKVIVDPLHNLPESFDAVNASFDNINILNGAGVEFAIGNLSSLGNTKAGALHQHAGNAVGNGLPKEIALAAITTVPAEWFGIDLGTIEAGADANLIVWDGNPLDAMSAPIAIYRGGESLSLDSRMTQLRDRYNPLRREDTPHKYR